MTAVLAAIRPGRRRVALGLAAALTSVALAACSSPAGQRAPSPEKPTPKASARTSAASVSPESISSVPARIAHTRLGAVGYRVVGSGPPLVLIMGYTGSMEDWDPRFVDALASHHRVVVFDNAGIGSTQAPAAPLTIDAMADQTSALISALGLRRPDVLGWSMGGMIAQALAVRHAAQVRRLVLCATYPGSGTVVPSQAAMRALVTGSAQGLISDLFPADQAAAYTAFVAAIARYPTHPFATAATATAQARAVAEWWAGTDPAGLGTAQISVPTLIADGSVDRLDPVANDHALAKRIRRARLVLYPDAGHAFLFQEWTRFTFLIESFLAEGTADG